LGGPAMNRIHRCDESCACPVHGTPLIYWPADDDHACQDVTCEHGHGMREPGKVIYVHDRTGIVFSGLYRGRMPSLYPELDEEYAEPAGDIFAAMSNPDDAAEHGYEVRHL